MHGLKTVAALLHLLFAGQVVAPNRAYYRVFAQSTPVTMMMFSGSSATPAAGYFPIWGAHATYTAGAGSVAEIMPIAGTIKSMQCYNSTALAAGTTQTVTLAKSTDNGVSYSDTTMTCDWVSDGSRTGCTDNTHPQHVNAGDLVAYRYAIGAGTPTATQDCNMTLVFTGDGNGQSMLTSYTTNGLSASAASASLMGSLTASVLTSAKDQTVPTPDSFTVKSFYVTAGSTIASTAGRNFYLCYSDGGATDSACAGTPAGRSLMSCFIPNGGRSCSELNGCDQASCDVVAGKLWYIGTDAGSSNEAGKAISFGVGLQSASNRWIQGTQTSATTATLGTNSLLNFGHSGGNSTVSGNEQPNYMTLGTTVVQTYGTHDGGQTATSANGSKTIQLLQNGSTASSCVLNQANATCNTTGFTYTAGQTAAVTIAIGGSTAPASNNVAEMSSMSDCEP